MSWTIKIGTDPDETILVKSAAFDLSFERQFLGNGSVESIDYVATVRGDLGDGDITGDFVALAALAQKGVDPVRIRIAQDGVDKFDWDPAEGFVGPHVVSFRSIPDRGNASSHWKYEMLIVFRAKPSNGDTDLYELHMSLTTLKQDGRIIRETLRASGKAKDVKTAVAGVSNFRPAAKNVSEQVSESATEAAAELIWVWKAIQPVLCRVRRTGSSDWAESGQAGKGKSPILHRLMDRAIILTVDGLVRGHDPDLEAPSPHLSENANIVRLDSKESNEEPGGIETAEDGTYSLAFREVWMISGKVPAVKHAGNHQLIGFDAAPKVGSLFT